MPDTKPPATIAGTDADGNLIWVPVQSPAAPQRNAVQLRRELHAKLTLPERLLFYGFVAEEERWAAPPVETYDKAYISRFYGPNAVPGELNRVTRQHPGALGDLKAMAVEFGLVDPAVFGLKPDLI